jgi:hypothetical protein
MSARTCVTLAAATALAGILLTARCVRAEECDTITDERGHERCEIRQKVQEDTEKFSSEVQARARRMGYRGVHTAFMVAMVAGTGVPATELKKYLWVDSDECGRMGQIVGAYGIFVREDCEEGDDRVALLLTDWPEVSPQGLRGLELPRGTPFRFIEFRVFAGRDGFKTKVAVFGRLPKAVRNELGLPQ